MRKADEAPTPDLGIVDDLARLGTTIGLLFRYWTVPMNAAPIDSLEKTEKQTLRIAALAVVVFLFLTLRPDLEHGLASFVFGVALAAAIAFLSNAFLAYNINISNRIIVGSYSFLACTLFIYVIIRGAVDDSFLMNSYLVSSGNVCNFFEGQTDNTGVCETFIAFRTAVLTFLIALIFVVVKSVFLDKNKLSFRALIGGALAMLASVLVCVVLDLMPSEIVSALANHHAGSSANQPGN